jgi:uncharacterized protein YjiS (DUF1127 family)
MYVCLSQGIPRSHYRVPIHRKKGLPMRNLLDVTADTPCPNVRLTCFRRLLRGLADGFERARTRRMLAQLDDRQLSDMGISHSDRLEELDKPFWR